MPARIRMNLWSLLSADKLTPGEDIRLDVDVTVDWSEDARLKAMREVLGGTEDGSALGPHDTIVFRRLDPTAPGGIGYMLTAQIMNERGRIVKPKLPD